MILFFDIETVGMYKSIEELKNNSKKGYDLFINKYEKRKIINQTWNKDLDIIYKEKSSILPQFGKIVCVSFGFKYNDEFKLNSITGNEIDILTEAQRIITNASVKEYKLCGFNINNFDIPWLNRKFIKYDLKIPRLLSMIGKKPWEYNTIDLIEVWNDKDGITFDEMCYELDLGSPKSKMDGSKVYDFYWGNDIKSIVEYCENDVKYAYKCYNKIFNLI